MWRSSSIEGGTTSAAHIAVESELGEGQHGAFDLGQRKIHLAARIFEDAKADDFVGEIVGVDMGIGGGNSKQNQQAAPDFARYITIHSDFGAAHALDDGAHLAARLAEKRFVSGECLPAAIAIGEDIGEANAGYDFASGVDDRVQPARKAHVALDVCAKIAESICV